MRNADVHSHLRRRNHSLDPEASLLITQQESEAAKPGVGFNSVLHHSTENAMDFSPRSSNFVEQEHFRMDCDDKEDRF